jgi:predicted HTH domain antitoxin|tara:strand:+ start:318 stop:605 length:288 start_codon:yes stop_codon:yes gene_type:complete
METVSTRLDPEAINLFGEVMKEKRSEVVRELVNAGKKHKAVELYQEKNVSLGLGARLAGVTLSEFIDLLKNHNVDLNLEKEDVEKALATARTALK